MTVPTASALRAAEPTLHAEVLLDLGSGPAGPVADRVHRLLSEVSGVRVLRRTDPTGPGPEVLADVDVVVACALILPDGRWQELDDRCETAGRAWHRAHVEAGSVWVGPFTDPGRSAGYRDLRARRLAASPNPDRLVHHWTARSDPSGASLPGPETTATAADLIVRDVLAHLRGATVEGAGHEVRVDGAVTTRHPVLPLPGWTASQDGWSDDDPENVLVDARTGVVTALRTAAPGPYSTTLACVEADVSDTRRFARWRADRMTSGATLGDPDRARRAALGEAVERYCGNAVPPDLIRGTADELADRGRRVVRPVELALYSAAQYATPGFPFVPLHDGLALDWALGRELTTAEPVLVPAAAVYLNGPGTRPGDPAPVAPPALAGVACGPTTVDAERAALEEALERDAITVWWSSGAPVRRLGVSADPLIAGVLADPACSRLDTRFVLLPSLLDIPVAAVLVRDVTAGLIGFGTACRPSTVDAARKALTEALVSLEVARELADGDGPFWADVEAGRLAAAPYRRFRADRAYRDGYRSDWRDLTSLEPNVQLYLDPRMQDVVVRRTSDPRQAVGLDAAPDVTGDPCSAYLAALDAQGLMAVGVDVTTDDVARAGLRVSRVVVPGLYQLAPAAFPLLGGTRLYRGPVERGWVAEFEERDAVHTPLPFS